MAEAPTVKAHCNKCGPDRNHELLYKETTQGKEQLDEQAWISWQDVYEMLRCAGCDSVQLRHTSQFSEREDDTVVYYPPAQARREPQWMWSLMLTTEFVDFREQHASIHSLLKEVYTAIHNDSRALAAMGVRAILDQVMSEKVGNQGTFAERLTAFKEYGFIAAHQAGILGTILDAGHASVHRGWRPSLEDLNTLLDVTEAVIAATYIHAPRAKDLATRVPARPARPGNTNQEGG